MPGGEALARQFVHGKRFFLERVRRRDRGGVAARLLRLHRRAAAAGRSWPASRWFLTQKISWNQTNKFPHHTFWWEGIDGTRIFTHFPPVDTYNAELSAARRSPTRCATSRRRASANRSLVPVRLRRRRRRPHPRDAGAGRAGCATWRARPGSRSRPRPSSSPRPAPSTRTPPVWVGELYLELHRAHATPRQASTKQGNRRSEHLLREAELWAATAAVRTGCAVPVRGAGPDLEDGAAAPVPRHPARLVDRLGAPRGARRPTPGSPRELDEIIGAAQRALAGDPDAGGTRGLQRRAARRATASPAGGAAVSRPPVAGAAPAARPPGGGFVLDNGLVRVDDRRPRPAHLRRRPRRRTARRSPPARAGNLLQLHPDLPEPVGRLGRRPALPRHRHRPRRRRRRWSRCRATPRTAAVRRRAPPSARSDAHPDGHRSRRAPAGSTSTPRSTGTRREKFLKAGLPAGRARRRSPPSEIQFGHVHRPTAHQHQLGGGPVRDLRATAACTSASPATASRWSTTRRTATTSPARSAPDGGTTTTVRLSLLRAPRFPDPETDQGTHRLRYALVRRRRHRATPSARATGSTCPSAACPATPRSRRWSPSTTTASWSRRSSSPTTGSGDVVVRLYEALGGRAVGRLAPRVPGRVRHHDRPAGAALGRRRSRPPRRWGRAGPPPLPGPHPAAHPAQVLAQRQPFRLGGSHVPHRTQGPRTRPPQDPGDARARHGRSALRRARRLRRRRWQRRQEHVDRHLPAVRRLARAGELPQVGEEGVRGQPQGAHRRPAADQRVGGRLLHQAAAADALPEDLARPGLRGHLPDQLRHRRRLPALRSTTT